MHVCLFVPLQLPSDVAARVLRAISSFEAEGLNIFVDVQPEEVMRQARASDERHKAGRALGLFDGVLVAVKVGDVARLCTATHQHSALRPHCNVSLNSLSCCCIVAP